MSDTADNGARSEPTPERVERGTRFVAAPAQAIFDLLADPAQHRLIDGSGTVRAPSNNAPTRLELGSRFGMNMKMGVPYRMTNEVVEFDEPRLIAWRHIGGHIWRYRLEEVAGGTQVTEEFDWRPNRAPLMLKLVGAPARNRASIEATLDRLAAHFAS